MRHILVLMLSLGMAQTAVAMKRIRSAEILVERAEQATQDLIDHMQNEVVDIEYVRSLLEAGANPDVSERDDRLEMDTSSSRTPLSEAFLRNDVALCLLFVHYGASFEAVHLCIAAENGSEDLCSFFLQYNSVDGVLAQGFNPFTSAAAAGKTAALTFLLPYIQENSLPYLSAQNYECQTPLSEAARNRKTTAIRWLLDRGVTAARSFKVSKIQNPITFVPAGNCYSLHEAAAQNASKIAHMLIEKGRADVHFCAQDFSINSFDGTPLHTAAEHGFDRMCVLLCDYGGYRNIFTKGSSQKDTLRLALDKRGLASCKKSISQIAHTCRVLIENALVMPEIPASLSENERERTHACSRDIKHLLLCLRAQCPTLPADLRIGLIISIMPEKVFELFRPIIETLLRLNIECKRNQANSSHECFLAYTLALAKIPVGFRQFLVNCMCEKTKETVAHVLRQIWQEITDSQCYMFQNEALTDASVAEILNPETVGARHGFAMQQIMKKRLGFVKAE